MNKKCFVLFYMIACVIVFVTYLVPVERNQRQENRQMAEFRYVFNPPEKESIAYRDSLVERLEEAMKDQFLYRRLVLKLFIQIDNFGSKVSNSFFLHNVKYHWYEYLGGYVRIDGTDWLTTSISLDEVKDDQIRIHIEQMNRIHREYPKIHIYNYFVNQAFDTAWFDEFLGITTPNMASEIEMRIPDYIRSAQFDVGDFSDYQHIHYKTDHHWNHVGAYIGYQDIYSMMSEDLDGLGEMAIPIEEVNYTKKWNLPFSGTFARGLGDVYSEKDEFSVYRYNLPDRQISVIDPSSFEEIPLVEMQSWNKYDSGEVNHSSEVDHYAAFYQVGRDREGKEYYDSRHIFKIENVGSEKTHNLLMIGDSYNRSFRDAMSTNFHTTIYLDHRAMSLPDIHRLIEDNGIDVILVSGHGSTWLYDYSLFNFGDE